MTPFSITVLSVRRIIDGIYNHPEMRRSLVYPFLASWVSRQKLHEQQSLLSSLVVIEIVDWSENNMHALFVTMITFS